MPTCIFKLDYNKPNRETLNIQIILVREPQATVDLLFHNTHRFDE